MYNILNSISTLYQLRTIYVYYLLHCIVERHVGSLNKTWWSLQSIQGHVERVPMEEQIHSFLCIDKTDNASALFKYELCGKYYGGVSYIICASVYNSISEISSESRTSI